MRRRAGPDGASIQHSDICYLCFQKVGHGRCSNLTTPFWECFSMLRTVQRYGAGFPEPSGESTEKVLCRVLLPWRVVDNEGLRARQQ